MFNSGNLKNTKAVFESVERDYKKTYEKMVNSTQALYSAKKQMLNCIHSQNVDESELESLPELFIPSKKVVSFHVFQKLTAFDLAYYVLRL